MMIELKPINSRFKRLIHDFGKDWVATCNPRSMPCFDGQIGVTCQPVENNTKFSNFKIAEINLK